MLRLFTPLATFLLLLAFSAAPAYCQGPVNALRFDGLDDHLILGPHNRGITDEVTVTAWVKTNSKKLQVVAAKYDEKSQRGFQLQLRDGRVEFSGNDGIARSSGYSPITIDDNLWHHVAGVAEKGTWTVYIDGTLQGTASVKYTPAADLSNASSLTIGKHPFKNMVFFVGEIDELRIWNKASIDIELLANMCQKLPLPSPNLVAYFNLDEGSGSAVKDDSALGLHGSLVNMNAASAHVVSGAPIGDKSFYTQAWKGKGSISIKNLGEATFSIDTVEAYAKVIHLYYIDNKPNYTKGLPLPNHNYYFGVFTSRTPQLSHTLSFTFKQPVCNASIYTRQSNVDQHWSEMRVSSKDMTSFSAVSATGRGEYTFSTFNSGAAAVNLPATVFACAGAKVVLDATLAGATYAWSNGRTTPVIEVTSPATVTVEITYKNCTFSQTVRVTDDECPVIPNVITPNGDGKNDSFTLLGVESYSMALTLFNRWGKLVYQSDKYSNDWGATGMAAGTYYYQVKSSSSGKVYKGWVEVVK